MELENFTYQVKRQRRKTLAVHVLPNAEVEVRAPQWVRAKDIAKFVEQHSPWILKQRIERIKQKAIRSGYCEGDEHLFLGKPLTISIKPAAKNNVYIAENLLIVESVDSLSQDKTKSLIQKWYRSQAQVIFQSRLEICWQSYPKPSLFKKTLPKLSLRKMRRRWGSCSSKGDITLNWMLVYMPESCIDYVINHELTHLWYFNHSHEFYQLLNKAMPEFKQYEALIEKYSQRLPLA